MLPENLDLVPKIRNAHETVDLGVRLLQQYRLKIYLPWICGTVLLFLTIQILGQSLSSSIRSLLFWWLAPLFEPLTLFIISRLIFKESPKFWELFKGILGILHKGASLSFLTFLRFSPRRALFQPVFLLEGGNFNKAWNKRRRVLANGEPHFLLTAILFAHAEALVSVLLTSLVLWICPTDWFFEQQWMMDDQPFKWAEFGQKTAELNFYCYALAVCALRPIYTASGFSCYLSRRVALEAWDIEISFRKLAQKALNSKGLSLGLMCVGAIFFMSSMKTVVAEELSPEQEIQTILAQEEFSKTKMVEHLFKFDEDKNEKEAERRTSLDLDFDASQILKVIAVCGVAYLLGTLLFMALKHKFPQIKSSSATIPLDRFEHRVTSTTAHLKEMSSSQVIASLIQQKLFREATALIYNNTLQQLQALYAFRVPLDATEYEALKLVKKFAQSEHHQFFKSCLNLWMKLAYAHHDPTQQELLQLFKAYETTFLTLEDIK